MFTSQLSTIFQHLVLISILWEITHVVSQMFNCSQTAAASCNNKLDILINNQPEYLLATNKTNLLKICNELNAALDCVDDHFRECGQADKHEVDKLFSGFRDFLKELCEDGSEPIEEFLKHAPCMMSVENDVSMCVNNSAGEKSQVIQPLTDVDKIDVESDKSDDNVLYSLCCVIKHTIECSDTIYRKHCGKETAQVGIENYLKMIGPSLRGACINPNGQYRCISVSVTTYPQYTLIALATLMTTFFKLML